MRLRWLGTWGVALALAACGAKSGGGTADPGGPADDALDAVAEAADAPKDADVRDFAGMEFAVCVPGTYKGQCTEDARGRVVCADDGTGWVAQACGDDSICLDDAVGCTACKPGNRRCRTDDIIERCDETGSRYEDAQDCNGTETGQICLNGACAKLCDVNAKLQSYIGCEYWGVDLDNAMVPGGDKGYLDASNAQYAIVVSNTSSKYPARVEIYQMGDDGKPVKVEKDTAGDPIPADPIPPLDLRVFKLGPRNVEGTVQKPLAFRVVSSIPISAYQFNPLENADVFSNDASLLLPSNALGKFYIVMTREQTFQELKGFLTVVGVYPGETEVFVKVTAPTLAGTGIAHMEPGETKGFKLKQFDVLNIETDAYGADLTGSVVTANHPVVVFGGSEAANAPNTNHCCPGGDCGFAYEQVWLACKDRDDCVCDWPANHVTPPQQVACKTNWDCIKYNTCCADHLEKQIFPVKTWGKEYVVAHTYPRGKEKDVYRILSAVDGSVVTTYPKQVDAPVLNQSEYVDFEASENFEVHAKQPVLVGQFLAAQDAPDPNVNGAAQPGDAETGDPTFLLAVPVEQFRKNYVFLTPDKYLIDAVNVIAPVGVDVTLDGKVLKASDLTFLPGKEIMKQLQDQKLSQPADLGKTFGDYNVIGQGKWAVWRVVVRDGVHVAEAAEPFGVIVYGYDQYVSYGYPAGLNLDDLKLVKDPGE